MRLHQASQPLQPSLLLFCACASLAADGHISVVGLEAQTPWVPCGAEIFQPLAGGQVAGSSLRQQNITNPWY